MDNKQVLKYIIGVHLHGEKDGTNDWNTALDSGLDPITDIIPDYPHEVLSCRETTHHDTTYVDRQWWRKPRLLRLGCPPFFLYVVLVLHVLFHYGKRRSAYGRNEVAVRSQGRESSFQ